MWKKISPYLTRERLAKGLLGQFQVPGWLLLALAIIIGVPDWNSRYQFWLGVVKSMGGPMSVLASALLWPYFPGVLGLVGVAFLFAGWNPKYPAQRHYLVPIVGYVCFAVAVVAIALTAAYGWHEMTNREAYAQGAAGIPRKAPDENNPSQPQRPLVLNSNLYSLQPDQTRLLLQEIPKLKPYLRIAFFSRAPGDFGSPWSLWGALQPIFVRSGIPPRLIDEEPRGPDEEGLMIAVRDPTNIPISAQKFLEAFEIANMRFRPIKMPDGLVSADIAFVAFLGPTPIN